MAWGAVDFGAVTVPELVLPELVLLEDPEECWEELLDELPEPCLLVPPLLEALAALAV